MNKPADNSPFGTNYTPKIDWKSSTRSKATRSSADGDSMRIKPFSTFPVTHKKKEKKS